MTDMPDTQENRSLYLRDLVLVQQVASRLKDTPNIYTGSVDLVDDTGSYHVGEVWYDENQDEWRWDAKRYGEGV